MLTFKSTSNNENEPPRTNMFAHFGRFWEGIGGRLVVVLRPRVRLHGRTWQCPELRISYGSALGRPYTFVRFRCLNAGGGRAIGSNGEERVSEQGNKGYTCTGEANSGGVRGETTLPSINCSHMSTHGTSGNKRMAETPLSKHIVTASVCTRSYMHKRCSIPLPHDETTSVLCYALLLLQHHRQG